MFTTSIYKTIMVMLTISILLNFVNILAIFIESSRWFMVILIDVLYQIRSLCGSILDLNIVFEFIALLSMILNEQGKTMGEVLYLARNADNTVKEKVKILRREKAI